MAYPDRLTTYYQDTRWRVALQGPTVQHARVRNASCGDEIVLYVDIQDDSILRAGYQGAGCVLSQAAAALACQQLTGMPLAHARELMAEDVLGWVDIPLGPVRARCALMVLQVLRQIIESIPIKAL